MRRYFFTAVVGCSDMKIENDESGLPCAIIGDHMVKEGMFVSIDGSTGVVYSGACMLT